MAAERITRAKQGGFLLRLNPMRELGGGRGFAGAVDADDGNHGRAVHRHDQISFVRAPCLRRRLRRGQQNFFHFGAGDGKHVQILAALGFVGVLHSGDDLRGHGRAEVGGNQGGLEFIQRRRVQFGRARDDAFDFVRQPAVGFLQAGFEFGKQTHGILTTDPAMRDGWT